MSLAADLMIVIGAILLTFGTDLVVSSASAPASVGAPLGVLVSIIGTPLLVADCCSTAAAGSSARRPRRSYD